MNVSVICHLVVVLHQLDDDPALGAVVLHGDDPHDVGSVLRVRVSTVLESDVNIKPKQKVIKPKLRQVLGI